MILISDVGWRSTRTTNNPTSSPRPRFPPSLHSPYSGPMPNSPSTVTHVVPHQNDVRRTTHWSPSSKEIGAPRPCKSFLMHPVHVDTNNYLLSMQVLMENTTMFVLALIRRFPTRSSTPAPHPPYPYPPSSPIQSSPSHRTLCLTAVTIPGIFLATMSRYHDTEAWVSLSVP